MSEEIDPFLQPGKGVLKSRIPFQEGADMTGERIRKKLKLDLSIVPYSLRDYGNTGSASIPLTLVTQCHEEYATKKMDTVACAFGVGFAWGSVHFVTDKIICPEVIFPETADIPARAAQ